MSKRVLVILEAGDALPSGIVRGLIYRSHFEAAGWQVQYAARLSPTLVKFLQSPPRALRPLVALAESLAGLLVRSKSRETRQRPGGLMKRLLRLPGRWKTRALVRQAKGCDAVYLSKVRSLDLVRQLRAKTQARLVLDFVDAIWLPNRLTNRFFDVDEFNQIIASVDAVTTDNEFTAAYARKLNPNCRIVPDYPQLEIFDEGRTRLPRRTDSRVVIGWIGSPSTAFNLFQIWEALERVFERHDNIVLRLVGCGTDPALLPQFESVQVERVPYYDQARMVEEVLNMDIGIFPLQDVQACASRGILKATIYMAGETAVIASPVGQVADFLRDGQTGLLASTRAEWETALDRLIRDSDERRQIARAGLEMVRASFSLKTCFQALEQALLPQPPKA